MIHRLFSEPLTPLNSLALDLSASNKDLNPAIFGDIASFCAYIDQNLGAKIGVGGYLEHRVDGCRNTCFRGGGWRGAQFSGQPWFWELWTYDHFTPSRFGNL
ncbi:MAG: hypothetical protein RLZZ209_1124 [Bacteroidota bacterium]